jgi:hypothetical protein
MSRERYLTDRPAQRATAGATRRWFLWSLASLGVLAGTAKSAKGTQTAYRLLTPEYQVRMSIQYFPNSLAKNFRFRDDLTDRAFCLSASGEEDPSCRDRFSGSIAVARYHFRSRVASQTPPRLRERVLMIDHDSRMNGRAPFETVLEVRDGTVSDIQAFGYNEHGVEGTASEQGPPAMWCLLRQELYLNDQVAAFLIVHWKHALDSITLVDVIPGERTQLRRD